MHSTTTMTVVLDVPEGMSEHEAQERVLQLFPPRIAGVGIHYVERTHGGVDRDGVATQPRAEARKGVK